VRILEEPVVAVPSSLYATRIKRVLDLLVSLAAIALLLPVMFIVAIAVRIALGTPVLFVDERAGIDGNPIRVAKFRSMSNRRDTAGDPLPDEERLGGFGRLLRRSSLDELPQLFSVLAGDMSLVGPRPLPVRYVGRYSRRQMQRLLVRPGLTGLAQILGRNSLDWPERLELDVRYVQLLGTPAGFLVDLWIMLATAGLVFMQALTGRGISGSRTVTMHEFRG
jgi:lipopolysaccharide/colanic/teichoic acid biosynthesis glycosyltransferase